MGGLFGAHFLQLPDDLPAHGGITLHDPQGNIGVALPGGILHHDPAFFPGVLIGQPHSIVVVQVGDGGIGALGADVFQTLDGGTLGHVDHRLLAQLVSCPCHAAAMVAVGGGDKGQLAQLFLYLGGKNSAGRQVFNVFPQFLGDKTTQRIAAAQNLESIEPETVAFVLHMDGCNAQRFCQIGQRGQRRFAVLGESGVKIPGFLGLAIGKCRQIGSRAVLFPQNQFHFFHRIASSFCSKHHQYNRNRRVCHPAAAGL